MAFYGPLRPGGPNHYEIRDIAGTWSTGVVRGWLYDITWGPADGLPGLTLDAGGPATEVDVLDSDDLERHLGRIDDFEGAGYRRVETLVVLADSTETTAWIYEADPEA